MVYWVRQWRVEWQVRCSNPGEGKIFFLLFHYKLPYACHYKPRLVFIFNQFSHWLRLILQTIDVLKMEILHFLSSKSVAYKRERLQIESGLWWRAYGSNFRNKERPAMHVENFFWNFFFLVIFFWNKSSLYLKKVSTYYLNLKKKLP